MQTDIPVEISNAPPARRVFNPLLVASVILLAVALILLLTFAWNTRDAMALLAQNRQPKAVTAGSLVQPWQTAVDLASLAVTAEEHQFASNALTLADHEVHQAFQAALNQAQIDVQKRSGQPDARQLAQVVEQRQQTVNQDQSIIKNLSQSNAGEVAGDLDLVNAQLDLDTDELKGAQQALARSLNDQRGELEQELAAHEAALKKYDTDVASKSLGALATSRHYGTLLQRLNAWFDQRTRYQAIQQAADQTEAKAALLSQSQNQLHKSSAKSLPGASSDSASRMNAMKRASMVKRQILISTDRMDAQKLLADTYRKWAAQVLLQHRIVLHLLLNSFALLIVILLAALLLDTAVRYFFGRHAAATTARLSRRQFSVRVLLRLAIQFLTAVAVFILIFGPPSQLGTALGLVTAGLTVVLQDFIISFCGWFVLMGRRGIRETDFVEINGIAGEVAEIGIFRTALLETGNWTDHGQPTGRHITFPNSFAIKGQYFNFTTNGQWMWDELTVTVPAADAYGTIELIDKAVLEETHADSELAEEEWRRTGLTQGLSEISTQASVHMRPGASGIDIVVRYVTRASNRYAVRNLINLRILDVIHKPMPA